MSYDPSRRSWPPRQERWPNATPKEPWRAYRDDDSYPADGQEDPYHQGTYRATAGAPRHSRAGYQDAAGEPAAARGYNGQQPRTADPFADYPDITGNRYDQGGIGYNNAGAGYAQETGYNAAAGYDTAGSGYGAGAGYDTAAGGYNAGNGYGDAGNGYADAGNGYHDAPGGYADGANGYNDGPVGYAGAQGGFFDGFDGGAVGYAGAQDGYVDGRDGYGDGRDGYLDAGGGHGPDGGGYDWSGNAPDGYAGGADGHGGTPSGYTGTFDDFAQALDDFAGGTKRDGGDRYGYDEADGFAGATDGYGGQQYDYYLEPRSSRVMFTAPDADMRPDRWQADQQRRWEARRRGLIVGAVTGSLAAAVAIGISTLAAAWGREAAPAVTLGDVLLNRMPPALKNLTAMHSGGKTVLLVGVIGLVAIGIGLMARRAAALGVAGLAAVALVSAFVAVTRPESQVTAVFPSVLGGLAGVVALLWLIYASAPIAPRGRA